MTTLCAGLGLPSHSDDGSLTIATRWSRGCPVHRFASWTVAMEDKKSPLWPGLLGLGVIFFVYSSLMALHELRGERRAFFGIIVKKEFQPWKGQGSIKLSVIGADDELQWSTFEGSARAVFEKIRANGGADIVTRGCCRIVALNQASVDIITEDPMIISSNTKQLLVASLVTFVIVALIAPLERLHSRKRA